MEDGTQATFDNLLAVETKRSGQHPSPEQATFLQEIRTRGGIGICVHRVTGLEERMRPFM